MNASERKEFIGELKMELVPALKEELIPAITKALEPRFGSLEARLDHHEDLLETIAMAVNAHATVLDTFEPKVKDHDERLERLERTVARIRLSHGLR